MTHPWWVRAATPGTTTDEISNSLAKPGTDHPMHGQD